MCGDTRYVMSVFLTAATAVFFKKRNDRPDASSARQPTK
jgi:hypothetical protein